MKHKTKVDEHRKEVQFNVGDLVMVHLNKDRLQKGVPHKLQMKRIGPSTILEKYGNNAVKVQLPDNSGLSPIFNVAELVHYKGPPQYLDQTLQEVSQDVGELKLPLVTVKQANKILDTRVYKRTRTKEYKEHLIQRHGQPERDAVWIKEAKFNKLGFDLNLLNPRVD